MEAELEGLICSGPRQGKQFTYALLSERAPAAPLPGRDEAIARLTLCYFSSRGPATLQDFQWWSGLNMADIKKGLHLNSQHLTHTVTNGNAYWFAAAAPVSKRSISSTFLLPCYDEYAVAYKDRSDILPAGHPAAAGYGIFKPVIVVNGQISGTWSRKESSRHLTVTTELMVPAKKINPAAAAYAAFMGKPLQEIVSV